MNNTQRNVAGGLLGLHALTSMHPGSGTALGTVDLPVQRERHTHWPNITGSAIKGILRDTCREQIVRDDNLQDDPTANRSKRDMANEKQELTQIFGPPAGTSSEAAGAVSVTDGRLLTFPVRSLKGVYALVTCRSVLDRLQRDANLAGMTLEWEIPQPDANHAVVCSTGCACLVGKDQLVLEEYQFTRAEGDGKDIAEWIRDNLLPASASYRGTRERFPGRFVILHDDDFTHFAQHATEVTARIGLDYDRKTVKEGALFYQEFLPAESLFYAVVLANAVRARFGMKNAPDILGALAGYVDRSPILQVGGDETTGKGYCATRFISSNGGK